VLEEVNNEGMSWKYSVSLFVCVFLAACSNNSGTASGGIAASPGATNTPVSPVNSNGPASPVNPVGATAAKSLQWTWADGANSIYAFSHYGSFGVASTSNNPGGRSNSLSWVDGSGNFWLFGGEALDSTGAVGVMNDLWEYSPSSGEWTWASGARLISQNGIYGSMGVSSISNTPGTRRYSATWVDASGNLWLFGGQGFDSTGSSEVLLNDLWKFNPTNSQWTWVGGSSTGSQSGVYGTALVAGGGNIPGARDGAATWTDGAGNFWLSGGYGYDSTVNARYLNDLWKFNLTSGQWTWMGGSSTGNQIGVYGTAGTASASNIPGSRTYAASWGDASGNFWLFGGDGYDGASQTGYLNDLWKFNPKTSQWTWVSGANLVNQNGVYGTEGMASAANVPGSRMDLPAWADTSGNFWLFGGTGFDSQGFDSSGNRYLGDLWKFNPATSQWTWVDGANIVNQKGVYGTEGTASVSNIPGGREGAAFWLDKAGNFWLFGGSGSDTSASVGLLGDLWNYSPK